MEATQVYHPLDGTELLKWLLSALEEKLSGHGEFSIARVYHNPYYKLNLEVLTFDAKGKDGEQAFQLETSGARTTTGDPRDLGQHRALRIKMESETPLLEPDKARESAKLGTYSVVKDGEIMVDKKEKP